MLRRPLKTYMRKQKNSQTTAVAPSRIFKTPYLIDSDTSDNDTVDNKDKTNPFESTFDRIAKDVKLPPPPSLPGPDESLYNVSSSFEHHSDSDGINNIQFLNPVIPPTKKATKRKKNVGKKIGINIKKMRRNIKTKINTDNDDDSDDNNDDVWLKKITFKPKEKKKREKIVKKKVYVKKPVAMETENFDDFNYTGGDELKGCSIELIRLEHTSLGDKNLSNRDKIKKTSSVFRVNLSGESDDDADVGKTTLINSQENKVNVDPMDDDDEFLPDVNNGTKTDGPENSVVPSSIFVDKTKSETLFIGEKMRDCYVDLVPLKLQETEKKQLLAKSIPKDDENVDRKDEETFNNMSFSKVNTNSRITLKKNCHVSLTRFDKIPKTFNNKKKSHLDVVVNINQSLMSSTPVNTRIKSRQTRPILSPIDKSKLNVDYFDTLKVGGEESVKVPSPEEEKTIDDDDDEPTVLLSPIYKEKEKAISSSTEEISTVLIEDSEREEKNQEDTADGTSLVNPVQEEIDNTSYVEKTPARKLSTCVNDDDNNGIDKKSIKRLLKPLSISADEARSPLLFDDTNDDNDDDKDIEESSLTLSSIASMEPLRIRLSPEKRNVDGAVKKNTKEKEEEESREEAGETGDYTETTKDGNFTTYSSDNDEETMEEEEEKGANDLTEEDNCHENGDISETTKEDFTISLGDGKETTEKEENENDTGEIIGINDGNKETEKVEFDEKDDSKEVSSQDEENTGEESKQEDDKDKENVTELGEIEKEEEENIDESLSPEKEKKSDENEEKYEEDEPMSLDEDQKSQDEEDDELMPLDNSQDVSADNYVSLTTDDSQDISQEVSTQNDSSLTISYTQESRDNSVYSLQSEYSQQLSIESGDESSIKNNTQDDLLKVGNNVSGLSESSQDLETERDVSAKNSMENFENSESTMKNSEKSMECSVNTTEINENLSTKINKTDCSLISETFQNLSIEKDEEMVTMETDDDNIIIEEKKISCSPKKSVNFVTDTEIISRKSLKLPEPYILLTRLNDPVRISSRRRDYSRSKKFQLSAISEGVNKDNGDLSKENLKTDKIDEINEDENVNGLVPIQEQNGSTQEDESLKEIDDDFIDPNNDSTVLYLKPGKQWTRSLSILNQFNNNHNIDMIIPGKGKKWRQSVMDVRNMQHGTTNRLSTDLNNISLDENMEFNFPHPFTDVSSRRVTYRRSKIIPELQNQGVDDKLSSIIRRKTSFIAPRRTTIYHPRVTNIDTNTIVPNSPEEARNIVFQRCKQDDCLPIYDCYNDKYLKYCHKIGEGVYGEVFIYKNKLESSVIKIIPIEGSQLVNGEPQKKFNEILSEIIIAEELHNLRLDEKYKTSGFVEVKSVKCLVGKYPKKLLQLWNKYDDEKKSENDSPSMFGDDQMYIALELGNGGQDLEAFIFQNATEAYSTFIQIALTLAVGEKALNFEHRDMHWGNILIAKTKETSMFYQFDDQEIQYSCHGIKVSIIDFTLSRITYQGCCMYNDLALDPALFTAVGEYQFDIYRLMKARVKNDWKKYEPSTNVFWLHYTLDKMITAVRYNKINTKIHKKGIEKLEALKDDILQYDSAYHFIMECDLITGMKRSSVESK